MILPTKEQILLALDKTDQLTPAPRTLGRALQLLRNPDSGLHTIAELISRDSALAVDVLRYANSAYYSRKTRSADVSEAVQVIGFQETIRLVSLVATRQTTHRHLGSYGIADQDFWAESLFNGLFLEALARRVGQVDCGEAYTSGLLRFVGRLAIDQALQDLGASLFWDGITPISDWEREHVGLTQAEVGARLLRRWSFPESIALAVEAQDFPAASDNATAAPLAQAMHFTAQVLTGGKDVATIEADAESALAGVEQLPFAVAHQLTVQTVAELLREARSALISIRETLYR